MQGEVVYLYAFDVANDVLADRIGTVLGQRPLPLELRLRHATPKDVSFRRPWVVVPTLDIRRAGQCVQPQVHEPERHGQHAQAHHEASYDRRKDVGAEELQVGDRREQDEHDVAGELGLHQARRAGFTRAQKWQSRRR